MSSLFYPTRHHHHQPYGYRGLTPYYGRGPTALSSSPWASSDPFSFALDQPFHQPFLSLFNDTFSQLDRLSNEMQGHLNNAVTNSNTEGGSKNLLTFAPKFDIKETEKAYILEGEMPGIERKHVNIEWADDNTLIVKGRVESYREEGEKPKAIEASNSNEASGALPAAEATKEKTDDSTKSAETNNDNAMTTKNNNGEVAKQTEQTKPTYHLTERTIGSFQRVFSFPGEVQHDAVKAALKNGILTVTIPKVDQTKQEKKARTVEVEEVQDVDGDKMEV